MDRSEEEAEERELWKKVIDRTSHLTSDDPISPPLYDIGGISTYDFIKAKDLNYTAGQVIKYISRYKHKNGLEDLKKAKWYLDKLISEIGAKTQKATLDEKVGWID